MRLVTRRRRGRFPTDPPRKTLPPKQPVKRGTKMIFVRYLGRVIVQIILGYYILLRIYYHVLYYSIIAIVFNYV